MNQNIVMILFFLLVLVVGLVFGWELKVILGKGKDPKALLGTADTVIDGVKSANDTFGKLIPAPIEFIIDKVLQTAQAGVHAAQQLCDSNQLTEDERKQKAFDSAMNLLKLQGFTPTPELEAAVKDAIETGVFVMKNIDKASAKKDVPATSDSVQSAPTSEPVASPESQSTPPKPITEVIQETIDQVGEQAKTQAVNDLTQQFAEVVQKAVQPVSASAQ